MSFKLTELNAWVAQISQLVNLVKVDGHDADLNPDWFLNPWGSESAGHNINGIPFRPQVLLPLLDQMLSPAVQLPQSAAGRSPAGTTLKWYPIQLQGVATGINLVLSDPGADYSATPGYVGMGLAWGGALGEGYSVSATLYLPLYRMDAADGGQPMFCSGDAPAQMLFSLSHDAGFSNGATDFTTIQVQGLLALTDGAKPSMSAAFLAQDGSTVANFTDAATFYTATNKAMINAALAAPPVLAWLNAPISATTAITPGQLLDAMGLLTQAQAKAETSTGAETGTYVVDDITDTLQAPPAQVALDMVFGGLDLLADNESPLFSIAGAGIYFVCDTQENGDQDYGMRFVLSDLALGKVPEGDSNAPANDANAGKPNLVLQIGKWLTGEEGYADSWLARSMPADAGAPSPPPEPGATLMVVRHGPGKDPVFHLGLALVSIGIDYIGSFSQPLVQLAGLTVRGMELRGALSVAYDPSQNDALRWSMGGAARVDNIGLPLGTSFDRAMTEGDNPPAANALASGDGQGGNAPVGETDAVSPSFSAAASYLVGGRLGVQLYDENDAPTDIVWFPEQAQFGPLFCDVLGIGWDQTDQVLSFIVDGGFAVAGFTAELIKLSVALPVTTPLDLGSYDLGLEGINVGFKEGPIQIVAGLLANTGVTPVDYEGQALIRAWRLSISALGAYSTVDDAPSLFVFAMLDFPLGGIPAFFIKGASAGFGFNRTLILPNVDQVSEFPLVTGIDNPDVLGSTPTSALEALGQYVPPSRGAYWLSAGLKWTTYELVNTSAVASVEFGNDFEIGIVGLSVVSLPQKSEKKFAYAELGLELALEIGNDEFIAAASLSPNSFILDRNFRLSGGFALDAWWGDSGHGGDFVVTLGGYAAAYQPPDYYPEVDRLGFSYAYSENLSMGGDLYFALTTSNIMAGGQIDVSASALGAALWFTGDADLILSWQPFYFDAHMAVNAGASYTLSMFGVSTTLKLEAGGTFNLWSPETGGDISIDFWFFNVPISFGAPRSPDSTLPVDWEAFSTMLPPAAGSMAPVYVAPEDDGAGDKSGEETGGGSDEDTGDGTPENTGQEGSDDQASGSSPDQDNAAEADGSKEDTPEEETAAMKTPARRLPSSRMMVLDVEPGTEASTPDPANNLSLLQINVTTGLIGFVPGPDDNAQAWLVRPALFGMSTSTVIPAQKIVMADGSGNENLKAATQAGTEIGILPMAATITEAVHAITITCLDTGTVQDADDWNLAPATMGMPASLWSRNDRGTAPSEPELIPDCLVGAADLRHVPHATLTGPDAFDVLAAFKYHVVHESDEQGWLPIDTAAAPARTGAPVVSKQALQEMLRINDPDRVQARDAIFAALAEMGVDAGTNGSLAAMAAQPSGAMRANPMLASTQGED